MGVCHTLYPRGTAASTSGKKKLPVDATCIKDDKEDYGDGRFGPPWAPLWAPPSAFPAGSDEMQRLTAQGGGRWPRFAWAAAAWFAIAAVGTTSAALAESLRIGMLSYATPDLLASTEVQAALSTKSCYCSLHGYRFILEVSPGTANNRTAHWQRIPFLMKHLPMYDWLFFTDADTVVTNSTVRLEDFVSAAVSASPSTFLIVQDDFVLNRLRSRREFVRVRVYLSMHLILRFPLAVWSVVGSSFVGGGPHRRCMIGL